MHRTTLRTLLVALLVAGLGMAAEATALATTTAERPTTADAKKKKRRKKKPTVKVGESTFGEILVDRKGRTLYSFDQDSGTDETSCTGGCASAWPPLEAKKPKAGKGLDKSLLESNSSKHVSYNGHLLYYYGGDSEPGDTSGQGVGGVWHVVDADGDPIA